MKKMSILVPAAVAGVLLSAMVLAAPQTVQVEQTGVVSLDRAAAYRLATAE
jgi:hypothetical protein